MDPATLTASAIGASAPQAKPIATLIVTKAFEKTGEKLGERALEQGGKLVQLLKDKFPHKASAIERVEAPPLDVDQAYLDEAVVQQVEAAAAADTEVTAAVDALAQTVTPDLRF